MKTLPSMRQIQYFVALYTHRNFQKAAESCNVSQSTLSSAIADLETTLQGELIDRSRKRQVTMTEMGEEFLQSAKKILNLAEEATHRAHAVKSPLSWPVTMAVIPTIAPYLLPRILKPLKDALPSLNLHIHEMQTAEILKRLDNGNIDFGLMAFPYDAGAFQQKILFEEKFVCAAPPGQFKDKKSITMKDLDGQSLLLLEEGHCLRDHALAACKIKLKANENALSATSLTTLIQLVHQGYGITLIPEMAVSDPTFLPKSLTIKPFSTNAPTRKIGFCYKDRTHRTKDIELVTTAITRILKKSSKD